VTFCFVTFVVIIESKCSLHSVTLQQRLNAAYFKRWRARARGAAGTLKKSRPLRTGARCHLKFTKKGEIQMMLRRLFKEEEGQTLVEYGLLVALIALVVIAALMILGQKVANTFNAINATLP
jgi:pilus assembly protein Flp/PilA